MTQDARDQERKQAPQSAPQEGQKTEASGTGEQEDASHEKVSNGSVSHDNVSNEDLASVFLRETEVWLKKRLRTVRKFAEKAFTYYLTCLLRLHCFQGSSRW